MAVWSCADGVGSAFQRWAFNATSGQLSLVAAPDLLLTVPNLDNHTAVRLVLQRRGGSAAAQAFAWDGTSGQLKSALNGMCVQATDPVGGTAVEQQTCVPAAQAEAALQSWALNGTSQQVALVSSVAAGLLGPVCLDAGTTVSCQDAPFSGYDYCNATLPADVRAADAASRLTAYEARWFLGGWYGNTGVPRLGIPPTRFSEALHGLGAGCGPSYTNASTGYRSTGCATSFPHATLLASSFNRTIFSLVGATIATELRAFANRGAGGAIAWTPDINLIRDPRWGRAQEVPSEDPLVNSEYAAAFVSAFQAAGEARYLRAAATCKHGVVYDLEDSDNVTRHTDQLQVSAQDYVQYFLPPWRACLQRGGAASIMLSLASINGFPGVLNAPTNNAIFREQWGWQGVAVSDCGAVADLVLDRHLFNGTDAGPEAAAAALLAGTDWNCGDKPAYFQQYLAQAVQEGLVPLSAVQTAAARVLRLGFQLGTVDPPSLNPYTALSQADVDTPASRALALQAAQQGMVLLTNNATPANPWTPGTPAPILPLRAGALRRVALVGPAATWTESLQSNYFGANALVNNQSLLLALQRRGASAGFAVDYTPGCPFLSCANSSGFADAVAAAQAADVTVVAVGVCSVCSPTIPADAPFVEREGQDRNTTDLPGLQEALIQQLLATGKPVVVVMIHGGPLSVDWTAANAPAVLDAHFPGQAGGDAMVSLLFGDVSPSGRETVTWYTSTWQTLRNMTDMQLAPHGSVPGATSWYYDGPMLWPFGWGLSYTTFAFAWADAAHEAVRTVDAAAWAAGAMAVAYSVNVTNIGSVTSDVSALAFASTGLPGQPLQQLFDFQRAAALAPGESVTLQFTLPPASAAVVDAAGVQALQAGVLRVRIGDVPGGPSGFLETQLRVVLPADAGQRVVLYALPQREPRDDAVAARVPAPAPAPALRARPANAAAGAPPPPLWAAQPVRGWNSWNAFGCGVNASKLRTTADLLVSSGLAAAGYTIVAPDDCWARNRSANGTILPDPEAFPDGMLPVAEYIRSKGLQFGIYTSIGNTTCAGRPGSYGYEAIDAATYASWGVQWAKIDNCNYPRWDPALLYDAWRVALDAQPYRIPVAAKAVVNYSVALRVAASRRVGYDISGNWGSMLGLAYLAEPNWQQARPGDADAGVSSFWTDVELLVVGSGALNANETAAHFWLWAAMHAPLMLSAHIDQLSAQDIALLTNPEVLAINHDPLGAQARRVALQALPAPPVLPLTPSLLGCSNPGLIAPGQGWELRPVNDSFFQVVLSSNAGPAAGLCLQLPTCNASTVTVDECPAAGAGCQGGAGALWHWDAGSLRSAAAVGPKACLQMDCPHVSMQGCHPGAVDQNLTVLPTGQLALLVETPGADYIGYPLCLDALPATHAEVWAAPLDGWDVSVLLLNPSPLRHEPADVLVNLTHISTALGLLPFDAAAAIRDVGARMDLGPAAGPFNLTLAPHSARFLRVSPAGAATGAAATQRP